MPLRYLWPVAIVVSLVSALWANFPWMPKNRRPAQLVSASRLSSSVAYITIDAACVNQLVKQAASEWMLGAGSKTKKTGLDLTALEASLEPPPPHFLEKGGVLPSEWRPEKTERLPVAIPLITTPGKDEPTNKTAVIPQKSFYTARLSTTLQKADFKFTLSTDALKNMVSSSGSCRFYLECNDQGAVEHVIRLSAAHPDAAFFERVLALGTSKTATSGCVDIEWMVVK
jgi:hypothetical protein